LQVEPVIKRPTSMSGKNRYVFIIYPRVYTKWITKRKGYIERRGRRCGCNLIVVLILLNILVLFSLFASNNGRDLLNAVSDSFFRIPGDIRQDIRQESSVTSGDQSHTSTRGVRSTYREHDPMECSHTHIKPPVKLESASPSIKMKAVAIR
jgi:hypothetical protein